MKLLSKKCHLKKKTFQKRLINEASILSFKEKMKTVDWSSADTCTNVNGWYNTWFVFCMMYVFHSRLIEGKSGLTPRDLGLLKV